MATNLSKVTVAVDRQYTLPTTSISYAQLSLTEGIPHKDQIVVFRKDIYFLEGTPTLSLREFREIGLVPGSIFTFNEQTREITAAQEIGNYQFVYDNGSTSSYAIWSPNENLLIMRKSMLAEALVTWVTGSRITADQLNLNTSQLLALLQELYYGIYNSINRNDWDAVVNPMSIDFDMGGNKIINVASPDNAVDAATKGYVDGLIASQLTNKLGQPNGIATLDATGKLAVTQSPAPLGTLPGSFFSSPSAPTRSTGGNGLFKWGSLWYNTTNGRLYVYTPDNRYGSLDETHNGEIGYWVDVASPAV
jgi:hypothetical protein